MERSRATLLLSLILAVGCGWLVTRTEAIIVPVSAIALSTCGLTLLMPSRWWLWALLIGVSVPIALTIVRWTGAPMPYPAPSVPESFVALVPAFLGAFFAQTFTVGRPGHKTKRSPLRRR
jgi:hypothetical protein